MLQSLPGHHCAKALETESGWAAPFSQLSKRVIVNLGDSWNKLVSQSGLPTGGTHVPQRHGVLSDSFDSS